MNENVKNDMSESIKLLDSLYVDLITSGLTGQGAKDKLISLYERILRINVSVIKESLTEDEAGVRLVGYYCDLCHATSQMFEYYRKTNSGEKITRDSLIDNITTKLSRLSDRVEELEFELYQRDVDIEELEKLVEERDKLLIEKYMKPEVRDKVLEIRNSWKVETTKVTEELKEKDLIIAELQCEVDVLRNSLAENENVKHRADNPALRIDVNTSVLVDMYKQGLSPYKIGKNFNMSQSAVIYRLKQAGVYVDGGRDSRATNRLG